MSRRPQRPQPRLAYPDLFPLAERGDRVGDGHPCGYMKLRPGQLGERPRAGEVIGVDVRVEDVRDAPSALLSEARVPRVHFRVHRSVDHRRLAPGANEVRKAPLAGAPDLHHLRVTPFYGDFGTVPGEAPGLHTALQSEDLVTSLPELLGGHGTGAATPADGDHGCPLRQLQAVHGPLVTRVQGVVGVDVHAAGYRPLGTVLPLADVHDRDPLATLQHPPQ